MIMIAACGPGRPEVVLALAQPDVPADIVTYADKGANAWSVIGVALNEHPPLNQAACRLDWFDQNAGLPCSIQITAYFYPISELGAAGLADIPNRVIYVGSELTGLELGGTVAHEVGHCIFNSGEHLPAGETGIMSVYGAQTVIPTKYDLQYAALHTHGWY